MQPYRHILVAVDFSAPSQSVSTGRLNYESTGLVSLLPLIEA